MVPRKPPAKATAKSQCTELDYYCPAAFEAAGRSSSIHHRRNQEKHEENKENDMREERRGSAIVSRLV
jgi:hypothetical protein